MYSVCKKNNDLKDIKEFSDYKKEGLYLSCRLEERIPLQLLLAASRTHWKHKVFMPDRRREWKDTSTLGVVGEKAIVSGYYWIQMDCLFTIM